MRAAAAARRRGPAARSTCAPRSSPSTVEGDRIASRDGASTSSDGGAHPLPPASSCIDATELGDLLPLAGAEYVVGAETRRRDRRAARPAASSRSRTACRASPTPSALERRPEGERHVIARPAKLRALPRRAAVQPARSRCTAARSTARRAAGSTTSSSTRMPGTKGGLWTYRRLIDARCSARASPTRPLDDQLARQRLPRRQHHRPSRARGRGGPAGRQAREPRLPALAADGGAGRPARGSARPSCGCGPTSWARRTACPSIPTSARRGASRR